MANIQNLKPIKLTHDEAVENGRAGGKKSVKVRREKRLLSQIYSDILAERNNLPKGQDIQDIIKAVIVRKDSSAVSMLKEIREATEGSQMKHECENFKIEIIGVRPEDKDTGHIIPDIQPAEKI